MKRTVQKGFSIFKAQRILDTYIGGLLIILFRPISLALEPILKRNHDLSVRDSFVVVKILGGGSLFVAAPSLYALKEKYPHASFEIVCSDGVKPFAELLGVFDKIHVIKTKSTLSFISTSFRSLKSVFKCDTILDLEIYSKLTSIFCLFTCARNRIGFFMNINSWQSGLTTHSLFLNDSAPIHEFYNQAAALLGADSMPTEEARKYYRKLNSWTRAPRSKSSETTAALAPFSSALAPEREFTDSEWVEVLRRYRLVTGIDKILILGGPADKEKGSALKEVLEDGFSKIHVENLCGELPLKGSAELLFKVSHLITIDSGMNHIARLQGIPIRSFYGPTSPDRLMQPMPELDETVRYRPTYCSPCVHLIDEPPCGGLNICMKRHLDSSLEPDLRKHGWLVKGARS